MRYCLMFFIVNFIITTVRPQSGYSKLFDFERPASGFINMVNTNDTLIVFGTAFHDSVPNLQGFLFAKFDTNGNYISHNTYFEEHGKDYVAQPTSSILKLRNNKGYVLIGQVLQEGNGVILYIDEEGSLLSSVKYIDETSLVDFYERIIETDSGFIVFGTKQKNDYRSEAFIMGINKQGQKIWERRLGKPNADCFFNSVYQVNENYFAIGMSARTPVDNPLSELSIQNIIVSVDSLGQEYSKWEGEWGLNGFGVYALQRKDNGDWLYSTDSIALFPEQNSWRGMVKIVERDSNFNEVWTKSLGFATSYRNLFYNLVRTSDENWIASGVLFIPNFQGGAPTLAGIHYKFSDQGDSLWMRLDTALYNPYVTTEHFITGSIALPSGSVVSCGSVNNYYGIPKTWAWLIKIRADGCIDTINCGLANNNIPIPFNKHDFIIFPNPNSGHFKIIIPDNIKKHDISIKVFSLLGEEVQKEYRIDSHIITIDLDRVPNGVYFISVLDKGLIVTTKQVVVHN